MPYSTLPGTRNVGDAVAPSADVNLLTAAVTEARNVGLPLKVPSLLWDHPGYFGIGSAVNEAYPNTNEAVGDMHGGLVVIQRPGTITQIGMQVAGAGVALSTAILGLYSVANPNFTLGNFTGTRVYTSPSLAIDSTGLKAVTGLSIAVEPGFYWVGLTATATFTPVEFEARPGYAANLGGIDLNSTNQARYFYGTGAMAASVTLTSQFLRPAVKFPVLVKFTPS